VSRKVFNHKSRKFLRGKNAWGSIFREGEVGGRSQEEGKEGGRENI
jgi:hypothetical protein